jgi:hypothetical protein
MERPIGDHDLCDIEITQTVRIPFHLKRADLTARGDVLDQIREAHGNIGYVTNEPEFVKARVVHSRDAE